MNPSGDASRPWNPLSLQLCPHLRHLVSENDDIVLFTVNATNGVKVTFSTRKKETPR